MITYQINLENNKNLNNFKFTIKQCYKIVEKFKCQVIRALTNEIILLVSY